MGDMDDLKVGTVVRAVRRRRGLRQCDVAAMAGVGQWAVSAVERGQLEQLPLRAIRRVCAALEIGMPFAPRWRGVELPRLADARHAALVERVVARLAPLGWETVVEYTFQRYGEQGSVDVLAWRAEQRALLLVEAKPDLDDLQQMLSVLDRKVRLVPRLVEVARGWRAATVGVLLAMNEGSTSRYQVGRHPAVFAAALPARNTEVRRWIEDPGAPGGPAALRGVWFLQPSAGGTLMEGGARDGGSRRVRVPRNGALVTANGAVAAAKGSLVAAEGALVTAKSAVVTAKGSNLGGRPLTGRG